LSYEAAERASRRGGRFTNAACVGNRVAARHVEVAFLSAGFDVLGEGEVEIDALVEFPRGILLIGQPIGGPVW